MMLSSTAPPSKAAASYDLTQFTNRIFYEDSQYLTDNLTKNRTFYEFILVDTKSVEITHHTDKSNPNLKSYSTCFTYVDYQKAFLHTFYLRTYDNSWFLSFDFHCSKSIPGWFYEWWHWFRPCEEIYQTQILKVSLPYYTKHEKPEAICPLPKISFHIDMGVPWILSWHFNLILFLPDMQYSLVREYRGQGPTKAKENKKIKKILEAIAMQISSSNNKDNITQDTSQNEDPYGGPLSEDSFSM
ncbi:hypothetical protein EUTSA_v10000685mg [Eutrema salsugineum]|uniref:Uncharacterized protein n=1 Tax=Eutrema salsugineum TaxID=72664 RepID=V4LRZ4_EUTSA|nr:hypothetical protein EUTSA_v10000685mg [Eutrema salsugineum]